MRAGDRVRAFSSMCGRVAIPVDLRWRRGIGRGGIAKLVRIENEFRHGGEVNVSGLVSEDELRREIRHPTA
jgi:hypothetical protein